MIVENGVRPSRGSEAALRPHLMDMMMPEMEGLAATTTIRQPLHPSRDNTNTLRSRPNADLPG